MTLSLPVAFTLQSSNVKDDTQTLKDIIQGCQTPTFTKGFLLQSEGSIWEYRKEKHTIPKWADLDVDAIDSYQVGDVVFKDCRLQVIRSKEGVGISEIRTPLNPEHYTKYETDLNAEKWTERYFRVSCDLNHCGWCSKSFNLDKRHYQLMFKQKMCYSSCNASCGNVPENNCEDGYIWRAKDTNPVHGSTCDNRCYTEDCLKKHHTSSYEQSHDIKATFEEWHCSTSKSKVKQKTLKFKSMIQRNGYFYLRTHLDVEALYSSKKVGTKIKYTFEDVLHPNELDFVRKGASLEHLPFDGKNYSQTSINVEEYAEWTIQTSGAEVDTIALSHVMCDSADILVTDTLGKTLQEINNIQIDNSISRASLLQAPETRVLYFKEKVKEESVIRIRLYGTNVTIGEILVGTSLDAGMTNANFSHKTRDLSPTSENQWGEIERKEGNKQREHKGTVNFKTLSYDRMTRLMNLISGRKLIINSSDSLLNQTPDGKDVFSSTMIIGRFKAFELKTAIKDKQIKDTSEYSFTIREEV